MKKFALCITFLFAAAVSETHFCAGFSPKLPVARLPTTLCMGDSRRDVLGQSGVLATALVSGIFSPDPSGAAVGSLPEFSSTNAVLQGLTVNVADESQLDLMLNFLIDAFDFKVLRQQKAGPITDTWLGFGPEQLSVPSDFTLPVSSFAMYGGHASLHIRYDAKSSSVLYRQGETAPGDNIAYLQLGVPTYRISQMVKNGGNVLDAYGIVNVVSPCGLPIRGIVGIVPDPIMLVAINCVDIQQSRSFYEKLGFFEQEYPYARPSKGMGQFEPPQPPKSVYLAPSPNSMGVLLLPPFKKTKKGVKTNPVVEALNVVYSPSQSEGLEDDIFVRDPSDVPITFQPVVNFEAEESATRVKSAS